MLGKKHILNECKSLRDQIQNLQRQIDELKSEQFTVEVVDSSGKTVMIPEGYFASNPSGYGFYNHKPCPKMQCVTLKQVVEAIVEQLGVKIEVLEQSPSKVVVRGK